MLRKSREIQDRAVMLDILKRCMTIRLGMQGKDTAYVVPVSFGFRADGDALVIYFHGSRRGLKAELLAENNHVCVEADLFDKVEPTEYGITTRYESVIGFGTAEIVAGEEKIEGLRAITEHYGVPDYPIGRCKGLEKTDVYKITVTRLTGKHSKSELESR